MRRFFILIILAIFVLSMTTCEALKNLPTMTESDDGIIKSSKAQTSSKYSLVLEYVREKVRFPEAKDIVYLRLKRKKKDFSLISFPLISMEKIGKNRFQVVLKDVPKFQNNIVQVQDLRLFDGKNKESVLTGKNIYIITETKRFRLKEKEGKKCIFSSIGENNITQ